MAPTGPFGWDLGQVVHFADADDVLYVPAEQILHLVVFDHEQPAGQEDATWAAVHVSSDTVAPYTYGPMAKNKYTDKRIDIIFLISDKY